MKFICMGLMSRHPGVKVGPFEIRPAAEETNQLIAERDEVVRREKSRTVGIRHRIGIKASIAKVYEALSTVTGIARWWTREVTGESNVGSAFQVRFLNGDGVCIGSMDIRVESLQPDSRIQWCFESGPAEWIGTNVTFALKQEGEQTIVLFSHDGWREAVEFTAHCSMKWATFLLSLKQEVENGQGLPSPGDLKIDNWN